MEVVETNYQTYKVDLAAFEGPLDLLLHLVQQQKVDINNIPISELLDQYMKYLELMDELNIDMSGDFILMASELALIKSKLLLPDDPNNAEAEELGADPRADLIRRLLEYQRYKEAAGRLQERPMLGRDVFVATSHEDIPQEESPLEVDLFNLVTCFSQILARAPKKLKHEVMQSRMSVMERIYELMDFFKVRPGQSVEFEQLFADQPTREALILTFLSILEMCKLKVLKVYQGELKGKILVTANDNQEEKIEFSELTFN